MKIETRPLNLLREADYNPRVDLKPGDLEFEKLKRSILEFGFVEPIIVNAKTNTVVGGHQRLKVLRHLGHTHTEVVLVELDPARERALNVALNKVSGEWDLPKLKDLLLGLDDGGAVDMTLTGFTPGELEKLIEWKDPAPPTDEEEPPALPKLVKCPECGHRFSK